MFDPAGKQIGKHRKVHMFDIDIAGGQRFQRKRNPHPRQSLDGGGHGVLQAGGGGVLRPALPGAGAALMVQHGAQVFVIPGAFNMTTGPAHWEVLFRARAVDNQVFTLGCAPARDTSASYVSYANSLVVKPWGEVTHRLGAEEGLLIADLDLDKIDRVRAELPLLKQRRTDLYSV